MPKTDLKASLADLRADDVKKRIQDSLRSANRKELLKLLASTEKHASSRESKFHLYQPVSEIAEELHKSKAHFRLLLGGNRGGKTVSACMDTMIAAKKEEPLSLKGKIPERRLVQEPIFMRAVGPDFPNGIEKILKPKFMEWAPPDFFHDYSAELRVMTFSDGTKIEFMTYDQDLNKHGGTSRHRIQFDEEPPESVYDESLLRIMEVGGDIIIAMTPVNGMTWVYDRLYLKARRKVVMMQKEDGTRELLEHTDDEGDPDTEVFILATVDNPHLNKEAVVSVGAKIEDPDEKRMRLSGEFISFAGLIYKSYDSRIHDVDDFHIPSIADHEASRPDPAGRKTVQPWPVWAALDPHPRVPHAYLEVAVDPYGRKFFSAEFFDDLDIEELALRIKELQKDKWIIRSVIDPWAFNDDPIDKSRATLADELQLRGLNFIAAKKDPTNGILRVREGLAKRDRQGSTGRVVMPEIYFFKSLKRLRWEIKRYTWEDWRKVADDRTPKPKPKDKDDHQMENLYRLMLEEPMWIEYEDFTAPLPEWRTAP